MISDNHRVDGRVRQRQTDFCVTVTARSPARDSKISTSRAARKFCTSRHRLHYKIVQTWLVVTMDERESVNLCVVGQQFIIVFNLPLGISENQRLARSSCLGKSLAIPECNVQVDVEFRCRCRMRARARPPQICVTVTQKSVCHCLTRLEVGFRMLF